MILSKNIELILRSHKCLHPDKSDDHYKMSLSKQNKSYFKHIL